jgi:hypothetical protein
VFSSTLPAVEDEQVQDRPRRYGPAASREAAGCQVRNNGVMKKDKEKSFCHECLIAVQRTAAGACIFCGLIAVPASGVTHIGGPLAPVISAMPSADHDGPDDSDQVPFVRVPGAEYSGTAATVRLLDGGAALDALQVQKSSAGAARTI